MKPATETETRGTGRQQYPHSILLLLATLLIGSNGIGHRRQPCEEIYTFMLEGLEPSQPPSKVNEHAVEAHDVWVDQKDPA